MRYLVLFALLIITSCTSSAVNECYADCMERAGVESQMFRDICRNSCEEMEYFIGEENLEKYNEQIREEAHKKEFAEDKTGNDIPKENVLETYSEEIQGCEQDYKRLKELFDEIIIYYEGRGVQPNMPENNCQDINMITSWSHMSEEDKGPYPGWVILKEELRQKQEAYDWFSECIPIEIEYKTAVYTERDELSEHELPEEAYNDCIIMLKDEESHREESLQRIKDDLPNWQ